MSQSVPKSPSRRLSLDHITVVDATPERLVELARATGCDGICLFQTAMSVLPLMPSFDCVHDRVQRATLKSAMAAHGVALDLAYPFTLSGRSEIADFGPALECAADLGAGLVNVLLYDRDPARRLDLFGRFCDLAGGFGLGVAIEFYPPSQIAALDAALELVAAVDMPGRVGVNVDLLHLMRSGGSIDALAAAPRDAIVFAQVADGMLMPGLDSVVEASSQRLLPGQGQFDIAGFVRALPADCPVSVEIPRDDCVGTIAAGTRAEQAVAGVRAVLA